jgi:hypothetical protein
MAKFSVSNLDSLTVTGGSITGITDLVVADGGTGASTLTDGGILVGSGVGPITALGVAANGEIPIGDGTTDPQLATITAGDGIDVTNGAASITVDVDLKANGGLVIESTEAAVDLGASSITGTLAIGDGGTGQTTASAAFGALKQDATDSATGVVELATNAESLTGTDTARAITPDDLKYTLDNRNPNMVNLLGNSGFGVWSNSEDLYDAGTGAAPVVTGDNAALISGGNLLSNGGFDSAITTWTENAATGASVAGGQTNNCLQITRVAGNSHGVYQTVSGLTVGKLYELSWYVKSGTSGDESYSVTIDDALATTSGTSSGAWVAGSQVWEATATSGTIRIYKNTGTAGTMLFDTVTLNEVTPGIVSGVYTAADNWHKRNSILVYREHNGDNTKDGSFYATKVVTVGEAGWIIYTGPGSEVREGLSPTWLKMFDGRTVTFGAWVKSSAVTTFVGVRRNSASVATTSHSGSGDYEWLEVTYTFATGSTSVSFEIQDNDGAGGVTFYASQPQLSFGSSIGEGNYVAPVGEIVWLENRVISSKLYETVSLTVATHPINLESDTSGKLPKGVVSIFAQLGSTPVAATDIIIVSADAVANYRRGLTNKAQVAGVAQINQSWCPTSSTGDLSVIVSGNTHSNCGLIHYAVQVSP